MKENSLNIRLSIVGNEIFVRALVYFNGKMPDITFILNNDFIIDDVFAENTRIQWEKINEIKPEFRCNCQNIKIIASDHIDNFEIGYHGKVNDCWYNIVTDDITALSSYSAWYPQGLPFNGPCKDIVTFENSEKYFVVKGTYDKFREQWSYGEEGYDPFNVIIYKKDKLKVISNEYINIYYVDPNIEKFIDKIEQIYKNILHFYNGGLFKQHELSILDIACVSPALTVGGAYRRKDLIFLTSISENELRFEYLLAHETAHEWCGGADASTWEDWLNETTAEWASLLYALEYDNDDLFHLILDQKLERMSKNNYPPIKTADGSRPDGVHDKGTILFYDIYKKQGKDVLVKMVRGFTDLEKKDTENYINQIEKNIDKEVAEEIKKRIN
jgi:hypothetical protein